MIVSVRKIVFVSSVLALMALTGCTTPSKEKAPQDTEAVKIEKVKAAEEKPAEVAAETQTKAEAPAAAEAPTPVEAPAVAEVPKPKAGGRNPFSNLICFLKKR